MCFFTSKLLLSGLGILFGNFISEVQLTLERVFPILGAQ